MIRKREIASVISNSHQLSASSTGAAKQRYLTPLRYPGGKQWLGRFLSRVLQQNGLVGAKYAEPFAGGAGAALYLLIHEQVREVHLNDADRSIYAFWMAVTRHNSRLRTLIAQTPITLREWDRQKAIQREKRTAPLFDLGFSTLYLNRTNRSGILRAGVIGGRHQSGKWRLDARFNKTTLIARITALASFAPRIHVTCLDAVSFLNNLRWQSRERALLYLDPPYFAKGRDLYFNHYSPEDHQALATCLRNRLRHQWVLTYDDMPAVRTLYRGLRARKFALRYTADTFRSGSELMFLSPNLKLPPS